MCKKAPDPLLRDIDSKRTKASTQLQKKLGFREYIISELTSLS